MQNNNSSFQNILFSILIPVIILNKGKTFGFTPTQSLVVALLFPICYGVYSSVREKKVNFISVLGLINVLVSGLLTLYALGGMWFAIKEAFFPLLIGIFVFVSSFTKNPFFKTIFLNPAVINLDLVNQKLDTPESKMTFEKIMRDDTRYLALSFVLSSALNYGLSLYVFSPIDPSLPLETKQEMLNHQLSQMTLYSMLVIVVPSMIFVGTILFFSIKKISALTGLKLEQIFSEKASEKIAENKS